MRFRTITALLTTVTIFAACSDNVTAPAAPAPDLETELAAIVGEQSATPNELARAQDRRDGRPPRERVTEEQRQCIQNAMEEFRTANAATLDAIAEIYKAARQAYADGATREEVRQILQEAQPLLERLREAHQALHEKIRACLTK